MLDTNASPKLTPIDATTKAGILAREQVENMGLYHPLDGVTNLKYKLLYFLTPNKKNFKEKGTSF